MTELSEKVAADFKSQDALRVAIALREKHDPSTLKEALEHFANLEAVLQNPSFEGATAGVLLASSICNYVAQYPGSLDQSGKSRLDVGMKVLKSQEYINLLENYRDTTEIAQMYWNVVTAVPQINALLAGKPNPGQSIDSVVQPSRSRADESILDYLEGPETIRYFVKDPQNKEEHKVEKVGGAVVTLTMALNDYSNSIKTVDHIRKLLSVVYVLSEPVLTRGVDGMFDSYQKFFQNADIGIESPVSAMRYVQQRLSTPEFATLVSGIGGRDMMKLYRDVLSALDERLTKVFVMKEPPNFGEKDPGLF